jgi:hypothetical protein
VIPQADVGLTPSAATSHATDVALPRHTASAACWQTIPAAGLLSHLAAGRDIASGHQGGEIVSIANGKSAAAVEPSVSACSSFLRGILSNGGRMQGRRTQGKSMHTSDAISIEIETLSHNSLYSKHMQSRRRVEVSGT